LAVALVVVGMQVVVTVVQEVEQVLEELRVVQL
jgi:hypothetical protein